MTFYIILQTCVITRWLVENRSLTVSVAASVKVWDYLVSLVLIRVWEWCDRSVCVCHSGNLSVLAPPHGKHQARTAWQTGAGSLPPAGARPVCHHLYGDITSTSTMLCSALVPLTWPPTGSHFYCHITLLLSYYYHIDFMNAVFVLFVYFNCYMFCSLLIFGWKRMFFVLAELLYSVKYDVSAEVWSAQWAAPWLPALASDNFTALLVYCASRVSVEGGRGGGHCVPTHRALSPPPADPGQNQIQTHYQYRISPLFWAHYQHSFSSELIWPNW